MVPYFKVPYFKEPQPYPKSEDIYIHSNVLTHVQSEDIYIYSNVLPFRVGLWFLILRNLNPTLKVKVNM